MCGGCEDRCYSHDSDCHKPFYRGRLAGSESRCPMRQLSGGSWRPCVEQARLGRARTAAVGDVALPERLAGLLYWQESSRTLPLWWFSCCYPGGRKMFEA